MPIYDYLCSNCGERTEVIHGIAAAGPRFCPACGAEGTLRKAFAPPTVHFKGSGWAKKDRSTAGAKAKSKPEPAEAGATAGSTDAGSTGGPAAGDSGSKGASAPKGGSAGSSSSDAAAS